MNRVNAGNRSAYPFDQEDISDIGLTKRELFAAMAMQGILSNSAMVDANFYVASELAVRAANTLIAELNKEVQQ